jgi:hypothetical protein
VTLELERLYPAGRIRRSVLAGLRPVRVSIPSSVHSSIPRTSDVREPRNDITSSIHLGAAVTSKTTQRTSEREPMGIVISRGRADDTEPRFVAYVWGEIEETDRPDGGVKAA